MIKGEVRMIRLVRENHLLGGVYAKISTDDQELYFVTEDR